MVGVLGLCACASGGGPALAGNGVDAGQRVVLPGDPPPPWGTFVASGGGPWASRVPTVAEAPRDDLDDLRALLYRIDGEARMTRLHPEWSSNHAQAAERMAADLADRLSDAPSLSPRVGAVERAARDLALAARRNELEDVRRASRRVEASVRLLDDALPPSVRAR